MQIASSKCRFINDSILCAKLKLIWLSGSKKYFIFQNSMEEKVFHLDDFSQNLLNKSPKDGGLKPLSPPLVFPIMCYLLFSSLCSQ